MEILKKVQNNEPDEDDDIKEQNETEECQSSESGNI